MYLLVFVTLIIGLLGIYAQILSLQAQRLAASQTGLARVMMVWHNAAVSMGASILDTAQLQVSPLTVPVPCSLTFTVPLNSGLAHCISPVYPNGTDVNDIDQVGTVTNASNSPLSILNMKTNQPEQVHLPNAYNAAQYQFYSVLYRDAVSNAPYVITFVTPPVVSAMNPAPGFISLPPTNAMTGFSLIDLRHQLQVAGVPGYAYGTVNSGNSLVTPDLALGIEYNNLPAAIPAGAVAVISSPAGF